MYLQVCELKLRNEEIRDCLRKPLIHEMNIVSPVSSQYFKLHCCDNFAHCSSTSSTIKSVLISLNLNFFPLYYNNDKIPVQCYP